MIPVSLSMLVFIYLALMLGLVFGAWLLSSFRSHRREYRAFKHVLRCTLCAFEFEDKTEEAVCTCPRCGSLNERRRLSRL